MKSDTDQFGTLASLALLKVLSDSGKGDYIDYIGQLAVESLMLREKEIITNEKLQKWIRTDFGLIVPLHPCELILRRLRRRNLIRNDGGVLHTVTGTRHKGLGAKRDFALQCQERLVEKLCSYADDELGENWTREAALAALVVYLRRFSLEGLSNTARGTALPDVPSKDSSLFIANSFVAHTIRSDPSGLQDLIVLFKGNMVANALTCDGLELLQKRFGQVRFYLDTPVFLALIGFDSEEKHKATTELAALLSRLDAKLCIFIHTIEEAHNILLACADHFNDPEWSNNAAIRYTRDKGGNRSDLDMAAGTIDDKIKALGIDRCASPNPDLNRSHVIDEQALEDVLRNRVGQERATTIRYDIKSVSNIFILRGDHEPRTLEDARHVVVTSNDTLARAIHDFGRDYTSIECVSAVITDYAAANIAWLKLPASTSWPRAELVANCAAAIEPTDAMWAKVLAEALRLKANGQITTAELNAVRASPIARSQVMFLTKGSEKNFSTQTVPEIIEKLKVEVGKEVNAKLARVQEQFADADSTLSGVNEEIEHYAKIRGKFVAISLVIVYCVTVTALSVVSLSLPLVWVAVAVLLIGLLGQFVGLPTIKVAFNWSEERATRWFRRKRQKSVYRRNLID